MANNKSRQGIYSPISNNFRMVRHNEKGPETSDRWLRTGNRFNKGTTKTEAVHPGKRAAAFDWIESRDKKSSNTAKYKRSYGVYVAADDTISTWQTFN